MRWVQKDVAAVYISVLPVSSSKCFIISELTQWLSGKESPVMQETWVWSLGREDPLEKEMATHSSFLAWRIPWTEELGRLQSTGSQRVRYDWVTSLSLLSGESLGQRSLVGYGPWDCKELDMTEHTCMGLHLGPLIHLGFFLCIVLENALISFFCM